MLVEPEAGACRAARSLFDYPTVQASADALPFNDAAFDAAWCLGVLCTTDDHDAVLRELRRVVRPPGRIGLLVFLAPTPLTDEETPEGNNFPTPESLDQAVAAAGLRVEARVRTSDLPAIPEDWQHRVDRVDEELERRYGDDPAWQVSERQSGQMGELLGDGRIVGEVLSLRLA